MVRQRRNGSNKQASKSSPNTQQDVKKESILSSRKSSGSKGNTALEKRPAKSQLPREEEDSEEEIILPNVDIDLPSDEEQEEESEILSTDEEIDHPDLSTEEEKETTGDSTESEEDLKTLNIASDEESENDDGYIVGDSLDEDELDDMENMKLTDDNNNDSDQGKTQEQYITGANGYPRRLLPEIDPVYDSDSSTENPTNTVGNIPMEWYDNFPHIGYDIDGKKIMKPARGDELDKFLENMEDPDSWISVKDVLSQENVKLTDEELNIIHRIQSGEFPDSNYDPYEPTIEWFTSKPEKMPVNSTAEPKRRFVPSKWEAKRIMKIVQAIRQGRIVPGRVQVQKPRYYDLWTDSDQPREDHVMHITAPKMKLPEHDESYNPPEEYLPTEQEKEEWENMDPDDREKNYLPKKYSHLREVPAYGRFIQERFNRCLDLYLAPRVRRNKLNIDPDSLIPKLPNPKDLQPFPTSFTLSYNGHSGRVRKFSIDPTGLWMVSASDDKTMKMWEITTGRCVKTWEVKETVYSVAWCPNKDVWAFAASFLNNVVIVSPTKISDETIFDNTVQYITSAFANIGDNEKRDKLVEWLKPTESQKSEGFLVILQHKHNKTIKKITWHRKGDYFSTIASDASNQSILVHQLSKHQTQQPFRKTRGMVQDVMFHPIKPLFFVATQRFVRVYNLMKQELTKTLQSGVKWISSLDIHPMGDNVIIGSYDKRLCWFDLDLSSKPYRTLRFHTKAIRSVAFHKRLPIFASCSDDGNIHIFHGMVYNDLMQNPLIVPVKIMRESHQIVENLGVLHCEFHPVQPWIISSGADHSIKLWT
ncbi:14311_t:CDS:10 [Acaulospora morrowiae]|uniref:Ribosome biogenesis protein ERB1 n=1 Tax=Acaulospora morrowiae TaxID=94023 RepID=A0A9N8WAH7_9GLOM|nr:14311_t:CDS:10 [Acaulospora morrowiae]